MTIYIEYVLLQVVSKMTTLKEYVNSDEHLPSSIKTLHIVDISFESLCNRMFY